MSLESFALLLLAGVGTGLVGYLTGLASLVSYPALLAAGLSPITANVTNTIGLVGVGVGATARAGREVADDRKVLVQQLVIAAVGGLVGAALLLTAGEGAFVLVVPWLVALASLAVLLQPWLLRLRGDTERHGAYLVAMVLVSIYGGYFGAGAGTIYLAVSTIATSMAFRRVMVLKSLLLGVTNLVAAVTFAIFEPVDWWAALALGIGCVLGGNLGPWVQQFLPERLLRVIVAVSGLFLAVWLGLRAYA